MKATFSLDIEIPTMQEKCAAIENEAIPSIPIMEEICESYSRSVKLLNDLMQPLTWPVC